MKFKEVAKHYIGCEVFDSYNGSNYPLSGVVNNKPHIQLHEKVHSEREWGEIKPILRKLEDMTEEDMKELVKIERPLKKRPDKVRLELGSIEWRDNKDDYEVTLWLDELSPLQFHYLASKGYDLFNLIEGNQAIDAKTVTAKKGGDGE